MTGKSRSVCQTLKERNLVQIQKMQVIRKTKVVSNSSEFKSKIH